MTAAGSPRKKAAARAALIKPDAASSAGSVRSGRAFGDACRGAFIIVKYRSTGLAAYREAHGLAVNDIERRFLARRLADITGQL